MAQELLDGGEVGTGVEQIAGVAAPQVVRGQGFDPSGQAAPAQDLADGFAAEGAAVLHVVPSTSANGERYACGWCPESGWRLRGYGPSVGAATRATQKSCWPPTAARPTEVHLA